MQLIEDFVASRSGAEWSGVEGGKTDSVRPSVRVRHSKGERLDAVDELGGGGRERVATEVVNLALTASS